jgi:hypothetical protein
MARYEKDPTMMIGYGSNNKGFKSNYNSWKRLNGGKKLTTTQMRLLQIKPSVSKKTK